MTNQLLNLALLIATIAVATNSALQIKNRLAPSEASSVTASYEHGDKFPPLQDYSYAQADRTLVLFLRSTCRYCTESMPFYEQLVREFVGQKVALVAVTTEPTSVTRQYLVDHGVSIDKILSVRPDYLKLSGTPTLVLVNNEGIVEKVWVGLQSAIGRGEILKDLRAAN